MNPVYILPVLLLINCSSDTGNPDSDKVPIPDPVPKGYVEVKYDTDYSDFPNPDRGFYRYSETRASNYTVLLEEDLKAFRSSTPIPGANYQTINTLLFRYFILDNFKSGSISEDFIDNMRLDFLAARNAGIKLIPRFTYTVSSNEGDCSEGFICPPYGDAPKEVILSQIAQLGPVLTENADVITCVQMGFIGTWGENYYTDYFGDASSNATQGKVLDNNWEDRISVLKALLDATPEEVMVQVRYPQLKQRMVYGIDAAANVAPMGEAEAFKTTDKARIGFHNDCLFASADDFGTYEDYGNSATPRRTDIQNLKPYFKQDSKYVIVGGETCSDGYSPENDCAPAGIADIELRDLHYTFLNADYNHDVNNDWTDGGCMDAIKRNLGYRFVLKSSLLPEAIDSGKNFEVKLNIENVGYTSPVKARNVKLVMRNKADSSIRTFEFDTDIRLWFDEVTLSETFTSENLSPGEYEVLLHIEDTHESLKDRPEYSIRLANKDIWEVATGYNSLSHTIQVK